MTETLQEFVFTPSPQGRIDREQGILHCVKILGTKSKNGRTYPDATLRDALPLYENIKVNLDHATGHNNKPRRYQDRFGVIKNVQIKENDGLYGDFRFNPKHPLAEQLLWDAENAPENVGFSHNVEAIVRKEDDTIIVEKIVSVWSVDIVADPATTAGLFESANHERMPGQDRNEATQNQQPLSPSSMKNSDSNATPLIHCVLKELKETYRQDEFLFGESFIDVLLEVGDPNIQAKLLKERMNLAREYRPQNTQDALPMSREQVLPYTLINTKEFVKRVLQ